MTRLQISLTILASGLLMALTGGSAAPAQNDSSPLQVDVNLVQLNIAVTDRHGKYISGLKPENFRITEDKIPENIASFEEGNGAGAHFQFDTTAAEPPAPSQPAPASGAAASSLAAGVTSKPASAGAYDPDTPNLGTNIFILFDTSNYMYRGFVYAQDAIADFVRSLDTANKIAFYSYSRNLTRDTLLTSDRYRVVSGVRGTVAGDDAALYNSLLLTVKDASRLTGRKAIVVFSNGPDNASSVPPEDVAELAQSTGTIIYIVSTRQAENAPISAAAFERVSRSTGGKAYFAHDWREENQAFAAIRKDISHLYAISYYPRPNPNHGWRSISVRLIGPGLQKYHVRTRDGYRLRQIENNARASITAPAPSEH